MNQFAEEIHKELEAMAKKYHMTKGILLFEETLVDTKQKNCRVILFQPDARKKFDVHAFAEFYEGCIRISKTFREVVNHMAMHLIDKIVEGEIVDQELIFNATKKKDKKYVN